MAKSSVSSFAAGNLFIRKSLRKQDSYKLSEQLSHVQRLQILLEAILLCLILSWLFYHSLRPGALVLVPTVVFYGKRKKHLWYRQRRQVLLTDFKDFAQTMASAMRAGLSAENAMERGLEQLEESGRGEHDFSRFLQQMLREMAVGRPAEAVWLSLSEATDVEELQLFGQIFGLSRRSGKSISEVLDSMTAMITVKTETENQIETQLSGKRTEQMVMNVMPAAILAYVSISSPQMMAVMYTTFSGRLAMTGSLLAYLFAFVWSERMLRSLEQF